jgi:peptidyl-tRNA hydrolase, PTH1 family
VLFGRDRRGTPTDWLVIGLGNPGDEFAGTRHNAGADAVELLARRAGTSLGKSREKAKAAEVTMGGQRVALAFPTTYMNLSGESATLLVKRHGIESIERVVVVHDELDLPLGALRVKVGGGLAGHNGLKSIRQHLHSADFVRVRIGIGKPPGKQDGATHVLKKLGKADREEMAVMVERAADAVETIVADGPVAAMNRYNATPDRSPPAAT